MKKIKISLWKNLNDKKLKRYGKKKFKIFIKYINVLYSNLNDSF